jgi:Ser/Thr protein kinase RdoA (MazF antagonist)
MNRNKTHRRRSTPDASGPFLGDNTAKSTENSLEAFFTAEAATFKQPWQKLDRGSRLDRLRKFVQAYEEDKPLTPAERASLLAAILHAFELRQLNSKLAVDYDVDTAIIKTVRGLHVSQDGNLRTFRIDPAPTRATQRRKDLNAETSN